MKNELYHHGVLGMKWGVRRTPAQLGHSTNKKKKDSVKDSSDIPTKSKTYKDMTDDELRKETDRLNLEGNYLTAKSKANPQPNQPQRNDSFIKKFMDDAVKPAIVAVGRNQIEKIMNTQISKLTKGKVDPNSTEALKIEAERVGLKSKISSAKKAIASNDDWFAERAKQKAQKEVDEYNEHLNNFEDTGPREYSKTGHKIFNRFTRVRESTNLPAVIDTTGQVVQKYRSMIVNSDGYRRAADRGKTYANRLRLTDGYSMIDENGNPIYWV